MTQILDMVLIVNNPDDFTDNLNMMLTMTAACYKMFIMWISYENISALINTLNEEPFKPLDRNELEIRRKFEKIVRNNTLRYAILIETTCTFIALTSLLTDFRQRKLTYREWVPYDFSSYAIFCFTYAQQMISTYHCATVNVACDALLCGFLMHLCCQLEILEYRLNRISDNYVTIGYCICHHNRIYEFIRLVNMRFNQIIGFQFIASTMVICSNLYQLTNPSSNTDHVLLIMYTCCMLTQIFIYCWFGNQVKNKNVEVNEGH
ncbi:odorant receptor 46a-like [Harpegnathos saltator]|uniref:odorant receptor 46a-like n=1 Tax=Harpegnathos saltator TaxID=610380 RepID=UPI000DBED38E|nr:odorant receptor 46a-like [Harpegnathos saltator]